MEDTDATQAARVLGPHSTPGVAVGSPGGFLGGRSTVLVVLIGFVRLQDD